MSALTGLERDHLRRCVAALVDGKTESGCAEIVRQLDWKRRDHPHVPPADRRAIGRALRELGWRRDGFTGIGYDREPRFVR